MTDSEPGPGPAPETPSRRRLPVPRPRVSLAEKLADQRRGRWIAPAVVLALLGAFALLLWVRSLPAPWIDFKDPGGVFSASYPETPKAVAIQGHGWDGSPAPVRSFVYGTEWEDEFYAVDICTYGLPVPADQPRIVEAIFDAVAQASLEFIKKRSVGFDAEIRWSRPYSLAGQPGREFQIDFHSHSAVFINRLLLVDRTHLVAVRTGVHSHHHGENDSRFFESFKLLGR